MIPPSTVEAAIEAVLNDNSIQMATTCEKIKNIADVLSPNIVKVVPDENDFALYFSRSPIPFSRDAANKYGSLENALQSDANLLSLYRKHTGPYVYQRKFLLSYTKLKQTNLEKTEMLEQLRALETGAKIKVIEVAEISIAQIVHQTFPVFGRDRDFCGIISQLNVAYVNQSRIIITQSRFVEYHQKVAQNTT